MNLGFVGLGNVGLPAALNLMKGGFTVYGYAHRPNRRFAEAGGVQVEAVSQLASCDTIVHSLPNVAALTETVDRLLPLVRPGQIFVDISSYAIVDKLAQAERLKERGATMLDCEISGLPHQVAARTAVVFKAGDIGIVNQCEKLFDALAERHFYLGPFGAATKMKLIANVMVCVHDLMAAEALNFGRALGLDPKQMVEVLLPSAAGSATFANKAQMMVSRDFSGGRGPFGHMFGYLDRAYALAEEMRLQSAVPLLTRTRDLFHIARNQQRHDQDIAANIDILDAKNAQGATLE
jgi:3-hydroxyisobutyrate dehydrogenase-like beta-hydroxyacid dehydrogenase